uniref:Transmembrane protein 98 n=1 Tax=Strix occidentalis caurina TaxID=311401 RepID=A0A8D0FRM8_STROC
MAVVAGGGQPPHIPWPNPATPCITPSPWSLWKDPPWARDPSGVAFWGAGWGEEHLRGSQRLPGAPITADPAVPGWHQTPEPPPWRGPAMETVVIVAIGVLATIFLASFVALVVVCRQRYCHPKDLRHHYDTRPIVDLMGTTETPSEPSELELDDVVITNPHIEAILENEDWVEDASGLVSHCIAILKVSPGGGTGGNGGTEHPGPTPVVSVSPPQICHTLTEKLVAMTMGSGARVKSPASLGDIIVVAKRISPR